MSDRKQDTWPEREPWVELVPAHVAGDDRATERLARWLAPLVRQAGAAYLGDEDADLDDVVDESILAVLRSLRKRGEFTGNLPRFAVTVARNRCRNLLSWRKVRRHQPLEPLADWIADPRRSPLDILLDREIRETLQEALDALDPACRELLRAVYLQGRTIEEIRGRLGLKTVQGVYYRRAICLQRAYELLNNRAIACSAGRRQAGAGRGAREDSEVTDD